MRFRVTFGAEARSKRAEPSHVSGTVFPPMHCGLKRAWARSALFFFLVAMLFASLQSFAQRSAPQSPHISAPPPAQHNPASGAARPAYQPHPAGQPHPAAQPHLNEWLQRNQSLTPQEQIKKLQQEQGFNRLSPQQQQNVTNHLRQLDQMPPEQRQRYLERVENMERLSPQQQQQVRGSARLLGQMPPDRQQAIKNAIRNLREVEPGQRLSELNSPKYAGQLNPEERYIVGNLLSVEPYHAPTQPPR